ncbi:mitochondrial 18 KDa protein-domain-containing protein [Chytridium lagenaria]|nr:mitochondrial 18 KDa protein-domain-containing protein [Chytridium lagenaria]
MSDQSEKTDTNSTVTEIDSVDTPARYLGLLGRLRTVVTAQSRLLAYTSEFGEAFRPVVPPHVVSAAYAVSWIYVVGDVGYEAYKVKNHGGSEMDLARTVVERGVFQSLASMLFPALTVHQVVHQSAKLVRNLPKGHLRSFGPTILGLSIIPILPTLFDHPIEIMTQRAFDMLQVPSQAVLEVRKINEGHHHTAEKKEQ